MALVTVVLGHVDPASAKVQTYKLRFGPISLSGYETVFPRGLLKTPGVNGYVVGMHARLVDGRGAPVTIRDVMLHHAFFHRLSRAPVRRACGVTSAEAFYGTGEENETMRLPSGYGYPLRANDQWRLGSMLMSHTGADKRVYVEYTVKVERDRQLTPVQAFWLRANGCTGPGYLVRGNGKPGSVDRRTWGWKVPYDMRIVSAGGHMHGGAKDMWLSQPRCSNRRLLDNRPSYGMPDNLYYRARPVLHEPGPIDTRWFLSQRGISLRAGQTLRVNATYDAEFPRTVMSVMHVYVARASGVKRGCRALPKDIAELTKPGKVRKDPPHTVIPLNGLDARGRLVTIVDPPWPVTPLGRQASVEVGDTGFSPQKFTVPAKSRVTWRFAGAALHNVRLADGPRLVVTSSLPRGQTRSTEFTEPGRYTLFCTRHPVTMHAIVDVLPDG